ncbi:MAG: rRNA maturation RNase YbeY [Mycoplasma sp.]|nr:rRNA maturation RNase YbeY [Mycoplasma sp.]
MLKYEITKWYRTKKITKTLISLMDLSVKQVSKDLKIKESLYFDVIVVDDQQMQKINKQFRKKDKSTDVITFALRDASSSVNTPLLGEIYLALDYILKVSKKSFNEEFILAFIHGILHLLGYDHDDKKKEEVMFSLQNKILQKVCK